MAHAWNKLIKRLPPASRRRLKSRVKRTLGTMSLAEIRKATGITQMELARTLGRGQGGVSKIENAADMYLSTLRRVIEAMGGDLTLTASFPDGRSFRIDAVGLLAEGQTSTVDRRRSGGKPARRTRRAA